LKVTQEVIQVVQEVEIESNIGSNTNSIGSRLHKTGSVQWRGSDRSTRCGNTGNAGSQHVQEVKVHSMCRKCRFTACAGSEGTKRTTIWDLQCKKSKN
jgi:hypothetical protein